ncbi:AAA family ATPase [Devosia psychrophila]|uniref:ATPase family associated with various cellular activities (AAA) n=1 Tax=Devosia psychrophila TaxID=728005 RepID=A0A1I1SP10_9HYPH|nr:ATP-binding protein [Devosia psychrophila]SFD46468.1 ATPase family associated with various cellular activities (AAA) [Devosia psychrophila]
MANPKKTTLPRAAATLAHDLALQLVRGLSHRVASELARGCSTDKVEAAVTKKLQTSMRLPTDRAGYAIALAHCLAPYYQTVRDLATTRGFIVIRCRAGDDAGAVGQVLADAVRHETGPIAFNPQYGIHAEERLVVISDAGVHQMDRMVRSIAQAAEECLPVFCTLADGDPVPSAFAGADLVLDLPAMTADMLALLFELAHNEVPPGAHSFRSADKLSTVNLVAHVRRARPAGECLAGLQETVCPPIVAPKLKSVKIADLAGYGEAKAWALELAQDMMLWRAGTLNWDEVDHRAVVLGGPPGTGKTSFAAVLANSLEVPLIASSVAEWNTHKHLSGTLNRMKEIFAEAMAKAPCVLLIDEIDGISSRTSVSGDYVEYWSQIINLMLVLVTEALSTPGVVIVGATNHVERIDPALMRSGRLDRIIRIKFPDVEDLAAILARYVGEGVLMKDLIPLVSRLKGHTGADVEKLVRAARASARRAGHPFSLADIEALVPDTSAELAPHTRRRISVYRKAQEVVAQVLGLSEMGLNTGDLGELLTHGLSASASIRSRPGMTS